MDSSGPIYALIALAVLVLTPAGISLYAWLCTRIAKNGGKVPVEKFGVADLIGAGALVVLFAYVAATGFNAPEREIHDSDLVNNAMVDLIIMSSLCSFLHFRGINLITQFGLRAVKFLKVVGFAFLFLSAIYPTLLLVSGISQYLLGPDAKPQELVKYFMDASQQMNYRTLLFTFFTGVVIAPIVEEFVFRGYIYGVLKRYFGITAGIVLNAALFAVVHVNAASLLPLFILAVCLTLAYEYKGSILVNMGMHSLFNFSQFSLMILLSSHHTK